MTQKTLWAVLLSMAVGLVTTVQAAPDMHSHGHRPLHGGIVAESADDVNVELVAKSDGLTFHVTQHGKPLATAGAKGRPRCTPAAKRPWLHSNPPATTGW